MPLGSNFEKVANDLPDDYLPLFLDIAGQEAKLNGKAPFKVDKQRTQHTNKRNAPSLTVKALPAYASTKESTDITQQELDDARTAFELFKQIKVNPAPKFVLQADPDVDKMRTLYSTNTYDMSPNMPPTTASEAYAVAMADTYINHLEDQNYSALEEDLKVYWKKYAVDISQDTSGENERIRLNIAAIWIGRAINTIHKYSANKLTATNTSSYNQVQAELKTTYNRYKAMAVETFKLPEIEAFVANPDDEADRPLNIKRNKAAKRIGIIKALHDPEVNPHTVKLDTPNSIAKLADLLANELRLYAIETSLTEAEQKKLKIEITALIQTKLLFSSLAEAAAAIKTRRVLERLGVEKAPITVQPTLPITAIRESEDNVRLPKPKDFNELTPRSLGPEQGIKTNRWYSRKIAPTNANSKD